MAAAERTGWIDAARGIGIVITIGLARLTVRRVHLLARLGVASLAIYLLHTLFSARLRMAMVQASIVQLTVMLVACMLIGIVGPLAVWLVASRYGVSRWAALGRDAPAAWLR